MEALNPDPILTFNPDTLEALRKLYNLDKPGAMDESIDILDSWIKQQSHFVKKDYSRGYLERCIIRSKGSIERSKACFDKICTARTLLPEFFDHEKIAFMEHLEDAFLPKLTKDNHRIYIATYLKPEFTPETLFLYYIRLLHFIEYYNAHDYIGGTIIIFDIRHLVLLELIKVLNIMQARRFVNIAVPIVPSGATHTRNGIPERFKCESPFQKGTGSSIKAIHLISSSKLISMYLSILRQIFSEKLANRIQVHETLESLYDYVDKDILPEDFGGKEVPLKQLTEKWEDILTSEDFLKYKREMNEAKTNEELRQIQRIHDFDDGVVGTFRSLNVD